MRGRFRRMGYRNISDCVADYGYVYSTKRYVITIFFTVLMVAAGCILFQLKWIFSIIIMMMALSCLPAIIKAQYYMLYQQKRFCDVDGYLHQMIYSFQKIPKISIALKDTCKISDGNMKKTINQAIDELNYGMSEKVYMDSLCVVEKEYLCERMSTLHRFMINVEEKGGKYSNSIKVLLNDIDRWVKRIYLVQQEIKKVKKDIAIGIMISIVLAATSVVVAWILKNTSEMNISISEEFLYQLNSSMFLCGCLLFYTYIQIHYRYDWLTKSRTDKQVEYDLKVIKKRKNGFVYKAACKRLEKDLYNAFSEWLRNVALDLQEKTLQSAIKDSYEYCPYVMKESLENFIDELDIDPADVTPYYRFLKEFNVPDISASVKTLYGLSELDNKDMDDTINTLIARNYELQDKHEKLLQMDKISLMKFSEYIPVFMVAIKMGLDMMLILTCYL